jgi:type VI protein secretion system component Hcp
MALESKMMVWHDSKHSKGKSFKVIDCKMGVGRPYDKQSPIGLGQMETLEVLMYPDYGETFFNKWFTNKSREQITLQIILLDEKGKEEEYLTVNLENAVCYALSETLEKAKKKSDDLRRLLRISIKAEKISIDSVGNG